MNRAIGLTLLTLILAAGCPKNESGSGNGESAAAPGPDQAQPAIPLDLPDSDVVVTYPLPPDLDAREESHQRMVRSLAEINSRVPDENRYLGSQDARQLREKIAALPSDANARDRVQLYLQLGAADLRLGRERPAIQSLTAAYDLLNSDQQQAAGGKSATADAAFQLGVAYMRLAETENCCQRNTPDSCIIPIRGGGIHARPESARKAIEYLTAALENSSTRSKIHLRARWLLNIAYMTIGEFPEKVPADYLIPMASAESDLEFPRFTNISSELGLDTFSMSGGAIADDFDGDSQLDLIVSTWDPAGQIRFFHNNGDGTFTERSTEAGLQGIVGGLNLVQTDYNNDRFTDLLVLRGAWFADAGLQPNSLIRNNGDGTFTDVTYSAGLAEVGYPTQTASWADYNGDGLLDVYIGNEQAEGVLAPCQLFENQGNGTFKDVARSARVTNDRFTKAVIWGDYDNDGRPDLYVSNLGAENRLYHNEGDGTFVDRAAQSGVTKPIGSFPAWFFDIDNDGTLDLFASSYTNQVEHIAAAYVGQRMTTDLARLYRGDGQGGFTDVAEEWGLTRPSLPMGSNFGDLNGDGYPDFYLGTGDPNYFNLMPNLMYVNHGGTGFDDVTMAGGFGHLQKGHAVVFADLDNDGDQDVFEQLGGAFRGDKFFDALFENPGFESRWLTVQLVGIASNRSAIGARIQVTVKEGETTRSVFKHVNSGGSFGANPLRQTIGLGNAKQIETVIVSWPTTGETQTFANVPLDRCISIVEGEAGWTEIELAAVRLGGATRTDRGDVESIPIELRGVDLPAP